VCVDDIPFIFKKFDLIPNVTSASNLQINLTSVKNQCK